LSDRVINQMKNSSQASCPRIPPEPQTQEPLSPLLTPPSPPFLPTPAHTQAVPKSPSVEAAPLVKLNPPPPVKFHSLPPPLLDSTEPPPSLESKAPSAPSSRAENPEVPESSTPPSAVEPIVLPPRNSFMPPHKDPETQTSSPIEEQAVPFPNGGSPPSSELSSLSSECLKPAPTESAAVAPLVSAATSPSQTETVQVSTSVKSPPVKPVISPSPLDSPSTKAGASPSDKEAAPIVEVHSSSPLSPPEFSSDEVSLSCQCEELAVVHVPGNVPPPGLEVPPPEEPAAIAGEPPVTTFLPAVEDEEPATVPPPAAVLEEELREKIRAEMERSLQEEINQKRQELQQQLEEMQALTRAEATVAAQAQVAEQVKKTLEAERTSLMEKLTESITKEKMGTEDEKLKVQLYAHQLKEREKEMKKRDELYKEQVSKLEAKFVEFCKVSTENFQKGKEETHKRFVRFNIQPLCGDLQGQILKCYKENAGRTLTCSGIASAYMQCVDNAKKDKLITGG
ncbi:hypothetical protein XENOCAPTIV_021500, partial [Xenoophorus captivus]